ncbi:acetyl-CoA carboxylase biotin carboxylase subunit family protein [Caballeronia sp. TF1N1]|uniref:ATP-grasp domain-containing protein n=1 Tax=Caballeronia sp. TF1N1 TaxID=2878153 RepID=UPI001FD559EA|nr:ATP-grasp domain-containing protein [Caballeronia sp. TF1N1]
MIEQNEPYILILGGEFPLRERVLAGALRASNGMRVLTLAKTRTSNTIKFFDGFISADVSDPEGVLAAVLHHEREFGARPAAVIPMNDFTVRSALEVSRHYQLNHNSADTVNKCRDKYLMKQVLAEAGLPVPRFGAFATLDELKQLTRDIGLPVVIKPRELAGSVGVIKVTSYDAIESAFSQCVADIKALNGAYMTPEDVFVVEEYIQSDNEVSVEVFNQGDIHRVIAVTDKYLGPEPYFVETGHSVPSVQSGNKNLRDVAERACKALGIQYGIAHFEARITENGDVRIIEVGARTGGDAIMDLVERCYGVNPYQLHVASYLGMPVTLSDSPRSRGLSAIAFLKAPQGMIERVRILKELPDAVVNMQVTAKPLDMSEKPLSWRAREGSVEFFWNARKPEHDFDEHLQIARQLSRDIFSIKRSEH